MTTRYPRPIRRYTSVLLATVVFLLGLTVVASPAHADPTCHADAPDTLADYFGHGGTLRRMTCDADVAVYFDAAMQQIPADQTAWISPFVGDVFRYVKLSYGACAVPRTLPAPIGPNCEAFGAPKPLIVFLHATSGNGYAGGNANRFDAFSGFRNTIDISAPNWSVGNTLDRDMIVHEIGHIVEGAGQGVHESPAYTIWGDSKWAEFLIYDFYANTGRTADASRVFAQFLNYRDNVPSGATNAAWFRDWFFPLWRDNGRSAAVMQRYFGLVSQFFPTQLENQGRNLIYTRRMTTGEFVHFMSGAAGVDLSARAAAAFNTGFDRSAFDRARTDFPGITYGPAPQNRTGMIAGYVNKCVDVAGANPADSTPVQLYTCNGTDAQRWTVQTNGTIRALGKCLDVSAGATWNGAKVQLYTCNGTGAQVWQPQANGTLRNPQSNKCLDVTDWSTADGTRLQIWDCWPNANQVWRMPT